MGCTESLILMRTKPTNFEAAKSVMPIGERMTADQIICRLLDIGRREIPTKKAIAVKFKTDPDIRVLKKGREPTIFIKER